MKPRLIIIICVVLVAHLLFLLACLRSGSTQSAAKKHDDTTKQETTTTPTPQATEQPTVADVPQPVPVPQPAVSPKPTPVTPQPSETTAVAAPKNAPVEKPAAQTPQVTATPKPTVAVAPKAQQTEPAAQPASSQSSTLVPLKRVSPYIDDPGDVPLAMAKRLQACRSGILVDLKSRRILWQKNAKNTYAIASMSKIMTALELVCELQEPKCAYRLDSKIQVPRELYRKFSDCQIYMDPRESFTLDELLKCMMIHSANDCAYLVGKTLGNGDEATFVYRMNARAKQLGLNTLWFCNTNGLPDRKNKAANRGSALDVAYLSEYVLRQPAIMRWASTQKSSIRTNTTRQFDLVNKNHLLNSTRCPGITGLKTGYIDDSLYCMSATCKRGDREMVCVVMGVAKSKLRDQLIVELLNWGYTVQ